MYHRHLNENSGYTCAAIDDIIGRGLRAAWKDLSSALMKDGSIADKILRVCMAKISDPYEQRYYFWKYHAEHAIT